MIVRFENDIALEEAFAKGEPLAFQEVFDRHVRPLIFFATQMIRDQAESEDIVMQTMAKLYTRHQHFTSLINIRAFLYITTRNACLDFLKFRNRSAKAKQELNYYLEENEESVLSRMISVEMFESIRQEAENLPTQRKAVFTMYYYENLSIEEIAEKLNTAQSTVRGNKMQALEQIRDRLFQKRVLAYLFVIVNML